MVDKRWRGLWVAEFAASGHHAVHRYDAGCGGGSLHIGGAYIGFLLSESYETSD
jgi:hypothetical protein